MSNRNFKPLMLATGAFLLGGLAVSQSSFALKLLGSGYQTTPDGAKASEGKCGEGTCGSSKAKVAATKMAEGKCGESEGSCGANKANATSEKMPEGKCGEGKCGAKMANAKMSEGKCGEGKCGMKMADENKDDSVTQTELRSHADAMFAKMDTDKDGKISAAEMKAGHEGKCGEGKCGGKS